MKKTAKTLNIITLIFSVIALAVAVFRGFILINFIEKSNGLYTNQTAGGAFLACMALIAVALIVIYLLLKTKDLSEVYPASLGKAKKIGYAMNILCFICLAVIEAPVILEGGGIISVIVLALCGISAFYFIIALAKKPKAAGNDLLLGTLGLIPALWAAVRAINIFMDVTTQINSSERSLTLTLLVCTMMMFVCEAGKHRPLDEEESSVPALNKRSARSYAFALSALSFSLIMFVSHIMLLIATGDIGDVSGVIISVGSGVYAVSLLVTCRK